MIKPPTPLLRTSLDAATERNSEINGLGPPLSSETQADDAPEVSRLERSTSVLMQEILQSVRLPRSKSDVGLVSKENVWFQSFQDQQKANEGAKMSEEGAEARLCAPLLSGTSLPSRPDSSASAPPLPPPVGQDCSVPEQEQDPIYLEILPDETTATEVTNMGQSTSMVNTRPEPIRPVHRSKSDPKPIFQKPAWFQISLNQQKRKQGPKTYSQSLRPKRPPPPNFTKSHGGHRPALQKQTSTQGPSDGCDPQGGDIKTNMKTFEEEDVKKPCTPLCQSRSLPQPWSPQALALAPPVPTPLGLGCSVPEPEQFPIYEEMPGEETATTEVSNMERSTSLVILKRKPLRPVHRSQSDPKPLFRKPEWLRIGLDQQKTKQGPKKPRPERPPPPNFNKSHGGHRPPLKKQMSTQGPLDGCDPQDGDSKRPLASCDTQYDSTTPPAGCDTQYDSTTPPAGCDTQYDSTTPPTGCDTQYDSTMPPAGGDAQYDSTTPPAGSDTQYDSKNPPVGCDTKPCSQLLPSPSLSQPLSPYPTALAPPLPPPVGMDCSVPEQEQVPIYVEILPEETPTSETFPIYEEIPGEETATTEVSNMERSTSLVILRPEPLRPVHRSKSDSEPLFRKPAWFRIILNQQKAKQGPKKPRPERPPPPNFNKSRGGYRPPLQKQMSTQGPSDGYAPEDGDSKFGRKMSEEGAETRPCAPLLSGTSLPSRPDSSASAPPLPPPVGQDCSVPEQEQDPIYLEILPEETTATEVSNMERSTSLIALNPEPQRPVHRSKSDSEPLFRKQQKAKQGPKKPRPERPPPPNFTKSHGGHRPPLQKQMSTQGLADGCDTQYDSKNPPAGCDTQYNSKSPPAGRDTQYDSKNPPVGCDTQYDSNNPPVGCDTQYDSNNPPVGCDTQYDSKNPTVGSDTQYNGEISTAGRDTQYYSINPPVGCDTQYNGETSPAGSDMECDDSQKILEEQPCPPLPPSLSMPRTSRPYSSAPVPPLPPQAQRSQAVHNFFSKRPLPPVPHPQADAGPLYEEQGSFSCEMPDHSVEQKHEDLEVLMAWWHTVEQWDNMPLDYNLKEEEVTRVLTLTAYRVKMGLQLFNCLMSKNARSLQDCITELNTSADKLDKKRKKAKIAVMTGGTTGALGGVVAVAGLALAPLTLGASLVVSAVGGVMATAGGLTGASAALTNKVTSNLDRKKIEKIVLDYWDKVSDIEKCLQFVSQGIGWLGQQDASRLAVTDGETAAVARLAEVACGNSTSIETACQSLDILHNFSVEMDELFSGETEKEKKGMETKFADMIRSLAEQLQEGLNSLIRVREMLTLAASTTGVHEEHRHHS